ncbi:hypothetical protein [Dickeya dianthicola]|uniref:DUF4928 domain-containing protein n=1 Tax=Dickeya dianthicola TaxID=204039 RepID=A0AAX1C0Z6_9GAMM|nr:hypothetical protein [Dickeya dianthicola]MCI4005033.1 hypothetical protein [Dickeya dianthicola]MCI4030066.1 hypothetical protein [Dickeya dianthicola]MCI4175081.1 hypothetical protein [Dickeya dianthicola]MCI4179804.1 hypothetical protein [Dickeya dianthicola]MCI4183554.1 hypothetical protein [Dickeya dianthicola]
MRIYMIDRNIVSKISSDFKNCRSEDKNLIKSLDTKGSAISLLLANIEGRLGAPQDMGQASFGMLAEGEMVKGFFKKARVDTDFFEVFNNLASWGITSHQSDSFLKHSEVVAYLQDTLHQPRSLAQAKEIREDIFNFVSNRGLEIGHPIVLCGLATLYGNQNARGVLKPKEPKENDLKRDARIYNALADLMVIVNLSELIDGSRRTGMNMKIHFETIDRPLRGFIREFGLLGVARSRLALVNDSTITLGFNMSLFPKLIGAEAEEFMKWINTKKRQT